MKTDEGSGLPDLCSEAPWRVSLVVSWIGPDLLCRIHGGTEHVGAIALGRWDGRRAHVDELTAGRHREGPLARMVADRLCRASRTTVVCLAGIHYDGIDKEQIEDILQEAQALLARAARQLEDVRTARKLAASGALLSRRSLRQ